MFIDEKRVVALEYIFYQKDEDYRKIKPEKEGFNIHHLDTDVYNDKVNPLSSFQKKPINLTISENNFLD